MMALRRFPVNQAWGFIFGQDVASASHISMDGQLLFATRDEAVGAAERCGLVVKINGEVITAEQDAAEHETFVRFALAERRLP